MDKLALAAVPLTVAELALAELTVITSGPKYIHSLLNKKTIILIVFVNKVV